MSSRSYSEVRKLESFEDRFRYLMLGGAVGDPTFGWERYLNQKFYQSAEWKRVRRDVIVRDNGCDLGVEGFDVYKNMYIHHINPMTAEDIRERNPIILDPDNLITVSHNTHNAIHYGDERFLTSIKPVERRPGDHIRW